MSGPVVMCATMPTRSFASAAETEIRDFDPKLASKMINEEDGVLIDCRTPQEFQTGAPPKAVLIPYDQIPARLAEVMFMMTAPAFLFQ